MYLPDYKYILVQSDVIKAWSQNYLGLIIL